MKKFYCIVLSLVMVMSLPACGGNSDKEAVKNNNIKHEQMEGKEEAQKHQQHEQMEGKEEAEKQQQYEQMEGKEEAQKQQQYEQEQKEKDTIENEDASLKCIGFEKGNSGLVKGEENIYVFKFDFINKVAEPKQPQNYFTISLFQNGAQLEDGFTYSSTGGEQYKLVGKFFDEAMGGGKITFGKIVQVVDDSPVTVYMKGNGIDIDPVSVVIDIANASEN